MKIICLIKFIPDVDNIQYDFEKNVLVRNQADLVINPDDAAALAFALALKKKDSDVSIEAITMAPKGVTPELKDILRRHVDRAVLISDSSFAGSDTFATAKILCAYLKSQTYDVILCGTHSLDGFTAHIPSQISEQLDLPHMTGITGIEDEKFGANVATVEVETDQTTTYYEVNLPAVLGFSKESRYKLPYVSYADLELDVEDRLTYIDNDALGLQASEIGLAGSLTQVRTTYTRRLELNPDRIIVQNDTDGIEAVYQYLLERGLVDHA
ncbi:MAG: electron transfer flavoprotein subunit beta/FixA family protein [Clostridiales Family XIII bacterium]|jgi:electron transfer flavoprotein beta subunit|nr:electron transfer flavoprotein subunit beta/FixA family protein [Clostridiales Family XIII bacterium]